MAWKIKEVSTEAGGLGYVYLQKTLIILFPITLLLTIIHQFIKNKWN
jgi:TRAP-type mannitol/chloroaromatic compound transport system permease small subunit